MSNDAPPPGPTPQDRLTSFTGGDPERGQALRRNLEAIRDRVADPEAARSIDRVLSGEMTMRELARDPAFTAMSIPPEVDRRVDEMTARWHAMSPEERAEAAREDQERLLAAREARGEDPPPPEHVPPFGPRGDRG